MFSSKTPSVLGLVIIRAAIWPWCAASTVSRWRDVHAAARVGLELDGVVAGEGGAGGVGAVGAVGDQHDGAMALAALLVMLLDDHQAGDLAVGAGGGLERDAPHAGDLGEILLQLVEQLERALRHALVLGGVQAGEAGERGHVFVDLGVVLHGAGAQGVEAGIDAEVALREVREVAHDLDLADLGQRGRLVAQVLRRDQAVEGLFGDVQHGHMVGAATGGAFLEDQRFGAHAFSPVISSSAVASDSMSSRVRASVTQKSAALPSSG